MRSSERPIPQDGAGQVLRNGVGDKVRLPRCPLDVFAGVPQRRRGANERVWRRWDSGMWESCRGASAFAGAREPGRQAECLASPSARRGIRLQWTPGRQQGEIGWVLHDHLVTALQEYAPEQVERLLGAAENQNIRLSDAQSTAAVVIRQPVAKFGDTLGLAVLQGLFSTLFEHPGGSLLQSVDRQELRCGQSAGE